MARQAILEAQELPQQRLPIHGELGEVDAALCATDRRHQRDRQDVQQLVPLRIAAPRVGNLPQTVDQTCHRSLLGTNGRIQIILKGNPYFSNAIPLRGPCRPAPCGHSATWPTPLPSRTDPRRARPGFLRPGAAGRLSQARLRFRNDRWAARIGLDGLDRRDWIAHFGRFEPLPGSLAAAAGAALPRPPVPHLQPRPRRRPRLSLRAAPRATGRLLDLGTKGSGQTPWSRGGDGRLTLKGGVREVLATEMLEALGVYTSKTFSLFETGEALLRGDEPRRRARSVLVRLQPQPHPHRQLPAPGRPRRAPRARRLVEHSIAHYLPEPPATPTRSPALLRPRWPAPSPRLAARVDGRRLRARRAQHRQLNITGESFDYGPWRFLPASIPASPRPISTRPASTRSAARPRR